MFKPTKYKLVNVGTGRVFEDEGWTIADPEATSPSLVRAVYENTKFTPREDLKGLYRYAEWLPIVRTLRHSHAPVTYKSKGLASVLGMENLYITFSGYCPRIGARMETCSFKETEAYSVCARLPKKNKRILVVQSAGNTARAFAKVCSDNNIPIVICVPLDNFSDLWFKKKLSSCVKIIATPSGTDYFDAITLGDKLCKDPRYMAEGGAKNVARRDGMGTTLLSAVEVIGRIPDAYFQAVGSGTGAIAAWENAARLAADGRFGENKMRIYASQNAPFTIMYDSWKAHSRELVPMTPEEGRQNAEVILGKVLSNRKPPYSLAGGLFDVLEKSGGDMFKVSNDEIVSWVVKYFSLEGYDLFPASACAVSSLKQALDAGIVKHDETVMLNVTGGGMLGATRKGFILKEPDLILSPDLPAEEIIAAVDKLF
ncbi:MAG: cysteate synthase [Bacteroides sp.]|nr:cysteate synthase [Bacteroides sp.]MDD6149963.1 cysteate synthase [Bacteroides sp.]MDY2972947.1 cysteate synthase [Candidatus Cryptobacteroides sp.]